MKTYDRESRRWVSEEEHRVLKKRREKCKGGAEHKFVEILPWGAEAGENYKGDPEPYYDTEKKIAEFICTAYDELERGYGIIVRRPWRGNNIGNCRPFMCSVCSRNKTKCI